MASEYKIAVASAADIVAARIKARHLAQSVGFAAPEITVITTAVSEVAQNLVDHAQRGEVELQDVRRGERRGLQVTARDQGPGIPDVARAMEYGYSTRQGLGLGLPTAKWLMDEFVLDSAAGRGTTVTMRKWLHGPHPPLP